MKALTKQRLLKVADAVEAAPPDRFNMGTWLTIRGKETFPESPRLAQKLNNSCGTAGCIAGWTVAVFPRAGKPDAGRDYNISHHAERILGLSDEEASALFLSGFQMNNRKAAERIRRAVADGVIREVGPRGGRIS